MGPKQQSAKDGPRKRGTAECHGEPIGKGTWARMIGHCGRKEGSVALK